MYLSYGDISGTFSPSSTLSIVAEILKTVNSFKYLGSTIRHNNELDQEIHLRIPKASQSFGRLQENVWGNKDLTTKTKCAVYQAIVQSTLLYGVELWTFYNRGAQPMAQGQPRLVLAYWVAYVNICKFHTLFGANFMHSIHTCTMYIKAPPPY